MDGMDGIVKVFSFTTPELISMPRSPSATRNPGRTGLEAAQAAPCQDFWRSHPRRGLVWHSAVGKMLTVDLFDILILLVSVTAACTCDIR